MGSIEIEPSFDIPKTYKALVYDKPGSISTKFEELETPEPGQGELLIRLLVHASPQTMPFKK